MGKEHELIKAVKANDHQKIQKLFVPPEKGFMVQKVNRISSPTSSSFKMPGGRLQMQLEHIDVNTHENETGYTPLILAVLNGYRDISETLLFYSADVNAYDCKGNTAMHMAIFSGRADMIELLIKHKSKVNVPNSDGNTPLHIACQCEIENRVLVLLKLLREGAEVMKKNKNGALPLDIAAMFNKKDAVSVLLDQDSSLRSNMSAIIEASIRGYTDVVNLLLDFGVNPNGADDVRKTSPLHEATRFFRIDAAEVLLKYGAKSDLENSNKEVLHVSQETLNLLEHHLLFLLEKSVITTRCVLPMSTITGIFSRLTEYKKPGVVFATPKFIQNDVTTPSVVQRDLKDYPELPTDPSWTQNTPDFCNTCTAQHPNTNILDGDLKSFWIIPEIHHAWTVLDLRHSHTLTGITVYGWKSKNMIKSFEIQNGKSLKGPWTTVKSFQCEMDGSDDPKIDGVPQTFTNFTTSSRFWRLYIMENHGGSCICFQGIKLHGVDDRILTFFENLNIPQFADWLILKGYNTYKKFLCIKGDMLRQNIEEEYIPNVTSALKKARKEEFPLTYIKWIQPPPYTSTEGSVLPKIKVKTDPGCIAELEVFARDGKIQGVTKGCLHPGDEDEPSTATFSDIVIHKSGVYRLAVRGVDNTDVCLESPANTEIKPKSTLTHEMEDAFNDMEAMLADLQSSLEPT